MFNRGYREELINLNSKITRLERICRVPRSISKMEWHVTDPFYKVNYPLDKTVDLLNTKLDTLLEYLKLEAIYPDKDAPVIKKKITPKSKDVNK